MLIVKFYLFIFTNFRKKIQKKLIFRKPTKFFTKICITYEAAVSPKKYVNIR